MYNIINSHIHLFDHQGINNYYSGEPCVGFADVDTSNTDYTSLYENYINNHKINGCLLSAGKTAEEMINIKNDHYDIIRGYGEIKLFKNDKYNFDRDEFKKLLEYNESHENYPIMIHYDLINNNESEIISYLRQFPTINFIHCHCGCSGISLKDDIIAIQKSKHFADEYINYYCDISWKAADLLCSNIGYSCIKYINPNKILIGTDTNIDMINVLEDPDSYAVKCTKQFNKINTVFGLYNINNAYRLFKL